MILLLFYYCSWSCLYERWSSFWVKFWVDKIYSYTLIFSVLWIDAVIFSCYILGR